MLLLKYTCFDIYNTYSYSEINEWLTLCLECFFNINSQIYKITCSLYKNTRVNTNNNLFWYEIINDAILVIHCSKSLIYSSLQFSLLTYISYLQATIVILVNRRLFWFRPSNVFIRLNCMFDKRNSALHPSAFFHSSMILIPEDFPIVGGDFVWKWIRSKTPIIRLQRN